MKNGLLLPLFAVGMTALLSLPPVCAAPPKVNSAAKTATRTVRQRQTVLPKPRLTVPLPDWQVNKATSNAAILERARFSGRLNLGSEATFVAATTHRLFFLGAGTYNTTDLKSIERATGALQWRQNVSDQSVSVRNRTISAQWQLLGVSQPGDNGGETVVLQQSARTDVQTGDRAAPWQSTDEWTLYGYGSNGNAFWQYPTLTGPPNPNLRGETVVGNLLLLNDGSDAPVLWNAQTGTPVDRTSPEGKTLVERAIAANGSPLIQRAEPNQYRVYRLDTGENVPFVADNPEEIINVDPLGVTTDRALWYKNGDNGMAGHSSFASSLWCADKNGRTVWNFPARTYYNGEFLDEQGGMKNSSDYARLYRDVQQAILCGARTDTPVAVAVVLHGSKPFMDGLRLRDGKLLWSHAVPERINLVSAGKTVNGAFFVQRGQLRFVDAATGKTRNIGPLPGAATYFFVADDDLITVDAKGILRIYSVKKLLGNK